MPFCELKGAAAKRMVYVVKRFGRSELAMFVPG